MPFIDRTVGRQQKSTGRRDGSRIGKGPRDGNQTWVAVTTTALYVGTLTMRLLATGFLIPIYATLLFPSQPQPAQYCTALAFHLPSTTCLDLLYLVS